MRVGNISSRAADGEFQASLLTAISGLGFFDPVM